MKVIESVARGLMVALKAKNGAKSTVKQLTNKLRELPRWAGRVEEPEDPEMLALFRRLCRAVQDGDDIEVEPDAAAGAAAGNGNHKGAPDPKAARTKKGTTPKGEVNKPLGVIDVIEHTLAAATEKAPVTKAAILDALKEAFPKRDPDSMKKTVQAQVPGRIAKERGLDVRKGENGYWTVRAKKPAK